MILEIFHKDKIKMEGAWSCIPSSKHAKSIVPRQGHKGTLLCFRDKVVFANFFGAGFGEILTDCVLFNLHEVKWTSLNLCHGSGSLIEPEPVVAYGMASDNELTVYIYGGLYFDEISRSQRISRQFVSISFTKGFDASPLIHVFDSDQQECRPNGRMGASLVLSPSKDKLILFGGLDELDGLSNDLWIFELKSKHWIKVITPQSSKSIPEPRESHTATIWGNQMVIVGGSGANGRYSDVWYLALDNFSWRKAKSSWNSGGFSLHTADLLTQQNVLAIFGGWHEDPSQSQKNSLPNSVIYFDLVNQVWSYADVPNDYFIKMGETPVMCLSDSDCSLLRDTLLPKYFIASGRAGHSSCCFNDEVLIWSGRNGYDTLPDEKTQCCFSDLWIFHPNTQNIFYLPVEKLAPPTSLANTKNIKDHDYVDGEKGRKRKRHSEKNHASATTSNEPGNPIYSNPCNPRPCYRLANDARVDTRVQLIDSDGRWNFAKAVSIKNDSVHFHYEGWSRRFNETLCEADLVNRVRYLDPDDHLAVFKASNDLKVPHHFIDSLMKSYSTLALTIGSKPDRPGFGPLLEK